MEPKSSWNCPNDRELTLRARLETGWSVKSTQIQNNSVKVEPINESEKAVILKVLNKSQQTQRLESDRINRMLERLNNMKRNAKGDGKSSCVLCNDDFGIFGAQGHLCKDCHKLVCNKCGVDTLNPDNETVWLCKICSETREMWKKSGAWFSNSLPLSTGNSSPSIPSINSPATETLNSVDNECLSHSSSFRSPSPSPVVRRKTRSPSPRSHRNRSPNIADYSVFGDYEKPNEFYEHISQEEYAILSSKQMDGYNDYREN